MRQRPAWLRPARHAAAAVLILAVVSVAAVHEVRARTVTEQQGVYDGQRWELTSSQDDGLCLTLLVGGRRSTGACGLKGTDDVGSGPGPAGSSVVFGPAPSDAASVSIAEPGSARPVVTPVRTTRRWPHRQRYFLAIVPKGEAAGAPTYLDRQGHPVAS